MVSTVKITFVAIPQNVCKVFVKIGVSFSWIEYSFSFLYFFYKLTSSIFSSRWQRDRANPESKRRRLVPLSRKFGKTLRPCSGQARGNPVSVASSCFLKFLNGVPRASVILRAREWDVEFFSRTRFLAGARNIVSSEKSLSLEKDSREILRFSLCGYESKLESCGTPFRGMSRVNAPGLNRHRAKTRLSSIRTATCPESDLSNFPSASTGLLRNQSR